MTCRCSDLQLKTAGTAFGPRPWNAVLDGEMQAQLQIILA